MAKPPGTSSAHELDTRLLRFRTRPGSEDASRLAADLLQADRAVDAIDVTAAGLRGAPDDLSLLVLDGRAHYAAGDLLRAQAALLKAARIAPAQKEPFRWLGEVLLKRGDPQRAIKVLERARAIDADDRTVQALHQRAERLARIADSEADADLGVPSLASDGDLPEERTVVRAEVSAQLANSTRPPSPAPVRRAEHDLPEEEDSPTSLMDRQDIVKALQPLKGAPATATRPLEPRGDEPRAATPGLGAPDRPVTRPHKATLPLGAGIVPAARPAPAAKPTPAPAVKPMAAAPMPAAPMPAASRPTPRGPASAMPPPLAPRATPPAPTRPAEPPRASTPPPLRPAEPPRASAPPALRSAEPPPPEPFAARPSPVPARRALDDVPAAPPRLAEPVVSPAPPAAESVRPPLARASSRPPAPEPEDAELVAPDDDAVPRPAPDFETGERAGHPEDVDEILGMLESQGIFEPPTGDVAAWAPRKEAGVTGTRIGVWMAAAWVLTAGLAAGGWFGWQKYVEQRHARAAELVAQAREEARIGDHQRLVDAERHLREARELNPNDATNSTVLLFVQAQLALEDGAFEVGYLRPAIARAERMEADAQWLHAARAVIAAGEGDREAARTAIGHALENGGAEQAGILYVAGRLEQRLGVDTALEHLQQAVERDAQLTAAAIALAEARHDEGRPEEAVTLIDQVLARDAENLRAQLWRAFLTADDRDPGEAIAALAPIEARLEHGAPTDRVLTELTRARLMRRQGEHERAAEAVDAALRAGAQEPRLLALMARAAMNAGRLVQAEYAATAAVRGSPSSVDFRKLLANIHLERRNGERAIATLAQLPADDPDVVLMTGRAAILVGSDEALAGAGAALDQYVQEHEDANVELRALRIRIGVQTGDPAPMLAAARQLARDNPGDPVASLALGEAALRARDPETAARALEQVVQASPDDAEGHYLLGRARRMQGDGEGAKRSLERAIALRSEHVDAKIALGGLLLDMGEDEAAERLYGELSRAAGSAGGLSLAAAGRLGRVEALIGLGRLDDAQVQMEGVREGDRETAAARLTGARLALARGRAGDAIRDLRALLPAEGSGQQASPTVLALYGDALLAAGQVEPSAAAYEQALATDSELPEALIGRAELYVRGEAERDAAPLLARARASLRTRIRPPRLQARLTMLEGRVALMSRDMDTARTKLREATAIAGVPVEAFFHLGEALAGENAPEARAAYERYLALAPEGSFASRARRAIR
ncbi:tetratricopeptide repeat protein [Sandaracinus amylolyticus]|uniref:Vegetative cell wall protein gp1 n=1 Tax=Sandaracinus amylolyticus TaxID=927083 RepID=A0A0F6W2C9_9BACT|nr:tetratricopeptide repeat protein [Sandaracinus amylolyticus]AKF05731.1 Vegetative cell wall protein gp1 precursor [Sandaracinus amylolyticus]